MRHKEIGDLTIQAKIGSYIKCIRLPDISAWTKHASLWDVFEIPTVGQIYILSAHVRQGDLGLPTYQTGIRITAINKDGSRYLIKNPEVYYLGTPVGEVFFDYMSFNLIQKRP